MALQWRRAWKALRDSGVPAGAILKAVWPLGREKRLRAMLAERRAVLDTKNALVDRMFRRSSDPAALVLFQPQQLRPALADPQKRGHLMAMAHSREMLDEVLVSRYGAEIGPTLDRALAELLNDGAIAQIPANGAVARQDMYVPMNGRKRPHFDTSDLTRLTWEGRSIGDEMRTRLAKEQSASRSRSYRL